jgi:predicted ATPase
LGKSRLVAEVIRSARRKGYVGYGGACQSDGILTPYLAWKSIWGAFFDVDPDMPLRKQIRNIAGEIEDRAPDRIEAMPLLNAVLDLNILENDFTKNLEPKIRQSALHALLEDCLKAQAKDGPTLIVIEDLHWIDALSHDLLEGLAKALANHAVCFVLAYRPPQMERLQVPRLEALPQFTRVELRELTKAEAESAIRAKLAQLYPARGSALPKGLVDVLMARAQGNPFYLEELLNYVRDRGLDPSDLHHIELPDSLHTLILSRIDQLSEQEKTTLRVASIVGRLFRAQWLTGYYPELGSMPQVKATLDALESLDITPLDSPEPELSYLFKHIVTHEVTYESLPFATRARLHEQLAQYLESTEVSLDTIAFHYTRSENQEKQREYLRKAGEAAQKNFANDATLEYYGRLLPLLTDAKEKTEIHLKRGQVLELMGKWEEAESDYRAALEWSKDDAALKASTQFALGKWNRLRGEFEFALEWLAQAREVRAALRDNAGLAQVLVETGFVLCLKGEIAQGSESLKEGLILARETDNKLDAALALTWLGDLAGGQGDYATGRALLEQSLNLHREIGEKRGIASSLTTLG